MQDLWLAMELSQVAGCYTDTWEAIPKGTASLVDWVKATARSTFAGVGAVLHPYECRVEHTE